MSGVVRIVVLDGYTANPGDNPWDELEALGDLVVHDRTPPESVIDRASGAAVLITNKTRLDATTLAALPDLRLVSILATGVDVVDVAAARARGIVVANVPEYSTDSVAQHVFALLLALASRAAPLDAAVKRGEWSFSKDFSFWAEPPLELAGLTFGVVGFGRIGRRTAEIGRAFGMNVIAASRSRAGGLEGEGFAWRTVDEVFAEADVVTLHCPLTPETDGLASRARLRSMKPTAYFVNTARGRLVDEAALAEVLREGRIAGAATDVASTEPIARDNPLLHAPRLLVTPHVAWATLAARRRLLAVTAANVRAFLSGTPSNVVAQP